MIKAYKKKGWQLPATHSRKSANMTISPMLCPAVTLVGKENPDHAKNQSDCKIRYPVLLGRKKKHYWTMYLITMYDHVHTCVCGRNCEQCKGPSFIANLYQLEKQKCIRTLQLAWEVYLLFPDRIRLQLHKGHPIT